MKNMEKVDNGNHIQETNFTLRARNWPLGSLSTFEVLTTSKSMVQFHQYLLTSKDIGNENSKRSIVSYHKNTFFSPVGSYQVHVEHKRKHPRI